MMAFHSGPEGLLGRQNELEQLTSVLEAVSKGGGTHPHANRLDETISLLLRERCFARHCLDGLAAPESSLFLQNLCGSRLDPPTARWVFALTDDGNPLFVKQLGMAIDRGAVSIADSAKLPTDTADFVEFSSRFLFHNRCEIRWYLRNGTQNRFDSFSPHQGDRPAADHAGRARECRHRRRFPRGEPEPFFEWEAAARGSSGRDSHHRYWNGRDTRP